MEWKKTGETHHQAGYRKWITKTFLLPDGREKEFTTKDEGHVSCNVALTTDRRVILAKQYRTGPEKILLELPAGGIDPGETPEQAAVRELFEETGYRGNIRSAGSILDCAYSNRVRHVFVVEDCVKIQEPEGDGDEFIEVVLLSLPEFRELLRSGQLSDVSVGYRGLDALGLLG